jgi:hypothetical protein
MHSFCYLASQYMLMRLKESKKAYFFKTSCFATETAVAVMCTFVELRSHLSRTKCQMSGSPGYWQGWVALGGVVVSVPAI